MVLRFAMPLILILTALAGCFHNATPDPAPTQQPTFNDAWIEPTHTQPGTPHFTAQPTGTTFYPDRIEHVVNNEVVTMTFHASATPLPGQRLQSYSNYYIDNTFQQIPHYQSIHYPNLWPGIDAKFYINEDGDLQYDFIIAPHTDPAQIQLTWSHDVDLVDGALRVAGLIQGAPLSYQDDVVESAWRLDGRTASFALGDYDASQPLIIDPVSVVATDIIDGALADEATDVVHEATWGYYVVGTTVGPTIPGSASPAGYVPGFADEAMFMRWYDHAMNLQCTAILGSTGTNTQAHGVDANQNIIAIVGETDTTFPTSTTAPSPGGRDALAAFFEPNSCHLICTERHGGPADDAFHAAKLDTLGDLYVTGTTSSTGWISPLGYQPTYGGGASDAFIMKLHGNTGPNCLGALYSSYIGGDAADAGLGIDLTITGEAVVAGWTESNPATFPGTPFVATHSGGAALLRDGFVMIHDTSTPAAGAVEIGGSLQDEFRDVAVDLLTGHIGLAGRSNSLDYYTISAAQPANAGGGDAVLTVLDAGFAPVFSTYFGGVTEDAANGVAVDVIGNWFIAGETEVLGICAAALVPCYPQINTATASAAGTDAFTTFFDPSGSPGYSVVFGGPGDDSAADVIVETAMDYHGPVVTVGVVEDTPFPGAAPFPVSGLTAGFASVLTCPAPC